ncbi:MAG TPA: glycosyl hydrolase [Anaerohalosphaeraceae bacterium]|nr:glycosyl hydrolase [Anaerohalosphaeraceae bacterium]
MTRLCIALVLQGLFGFAFGNEDLAKNFASPPAESRPWVYWFWLNGNLTREGMTADLEAMQRAGIGGVLIMEVDQGAPVGPVAFMSDAWRELFKHAMSEAHRLGLEVNMNNDAGWNGSGGPWVPLDKTMQVIVTSEKQVPGGAKFEGQLPAPRANESFYRDIVVLAFPTPKDPDNPANRIQNLSAKGMFWNGIYGGSLHDAGAAGVPAESIIAKDTIVDLSGRMTANGVLAWEAPLLPDSGTWTVIRFGHTFTGAKSHPAPATGAGPECDKLSKEGIEANYNGMIGKLVGDVGPLAGKTFAATHVDSWEVGSQNWTPKMQDEFKRLRDYDMTPMLPVLAGRIVGSLDISERFLRDVRQTISDLLAENYIGHLRTLANRDGLRLSMEAYSAPANDLDVANHIEEPICEFWWPDGGGFYWSVKSMASVAHVNGLPVVGAEAFTAADGERWLAHPANIKALGDRAFCDGVNRFIVHRYAMQPWITNRWPGMTMGPWGVHYERSNTWWEQSKAWHQYVARCQYLLRQGRFVADVLSLQSEEPMQRFKPLKLTGYDYDAISPQAFLEKVTVKNGLLELPSGMKYHLLCLPEDESMTPRMLEKIAALTQAGARIIGNPPVKAPGLSGYPQSDAQVKALAAKLWDSGANSEGKMVKGRIVAGKSPAEVLAAAGIGPDFLASRPIRYIHRVVADKDLYFVANPARMAVEAVCTFRVSGKTPEAWFPDTGRIEPISVFHENDGCTRIPLRFEASGSMFIVFHPGKAQASEQIVSVKHDGMELVRMETANFSAQNSDVANTFTMAAWVKPTIEIALPQETNEGLAALSVERNDVLYPAPGHEVWTDKDSGAGFGVGTNGVCVCEHGDTYFPSLLVYKTPISDWTHAAIVYRAGTPSLYLNGKLVHTGMKSRKIVHSGVSVIHGREINEFRGQVAGLQDFPKALSDEEIAKLAQSQPSIAEAERGPAMDFVRQEVFKKGLYELKTADGKTRRVHVVDLPWPVVLQGPWDVKFAPGLGVPENMVFEDLMSWSEHSEQGVKYFSGAATYRKTFDFKPATMSDPQIKSIITLDLGKVAVIAEVSLNGRNMGILWKPPYRVDITDAIKSGQNNLEIRVVNLPVNRMLGDELLPEDSDRNANGTLKQWPQWLQDGKPSPTGRFTFTSWRLWKKGEPLQDSGLLGPVTVVTTARIN